MQTKGSEKTLKRIGNNRSNRFTENLTGYLMIAPNLIGFLVFTLFGIGFFILFMLLIGGLFRGMAYRRWGGPPPPGPWSHYWRQEHEHEHGSAPEEKKE